MAFINSLITWFMRKRIHQIELFLKYPSEVQEEWLETLLRSARDTEWGKTYNYSGIKNYEQFKNYVPLTNYEKLTPYIDRLRKGEDNILWHSEVKWFAKSSGTTENKSKFIPVTAEALNNCHYKGGKDMLSLYFNNNPESQIFDGKALAMGGSYKSDNEVANTFYGDVSAILMENLPFWIQLMRTPELNVALMEDWEEKLVQMALLTKEENVTSITGVPSWTLILLQKILELTGKQHLRDVWPNLELFVHGGVSFAPYKTQFAEICPESMHYIQTYNASEGFFGIQDQLNADDMLLMLDYGIFYEFIPLEELHETDPKCYPIWEVETNRNYAMVISTNAGLWRYIIGDTIEFTSLSPHRIKITGRTKSYINTFGEEVIIDNAEKALNLACEKTNSAYTDYTVAPKFFDNGSTASHEWAIEFEKKPEDINLFIEMLDNALKAINSDYEAKRYKNLMLQLPIVNSLPKGSFYNWMKAKGKLGGQYKVPRLNNDRKNMDELLASIK